MFNLISRGIRAILIGLVKIYQAVLSPFLGQSCRHVPSCSNYTIDAIKEWGPLKGSWMGFRRILRCNPWGTSGYDPVPKRDSSSREGEDD